MTMYRKKKQVKVCGILMCPLAIGCSAFIQNQEGNDPIRTTAVKRFIRLPLGMTYIETRNTRYLLRQPGKAAAKGVRV